MRNNYYPISDMLPSVYMDYHGGNFKTVDGMESWQKCGKVCSGPTSKRISFWNTIVNCHRNFYSAQQCKEESDCKAWVWNHRSSWHSRGNQCSLKDSLPQLITSHDPLVAGTKEMYEGSCPYVYKDHYGEHFRTERDVQSWKDCCKLENQYFCSSYKTWVFFT